MASIKEVAKYAGVSIATVSHVINNTRFVSEETQKLVLDAIQKLDYRTNSLASGLRSRKTKTFGMIIPDSTNLFFAEIAQAIEQSAFKIGYQIILCNTDNDLDKEMRQVDVLLSKQVDGVILIPSGDDYASLHKLRKYGVPYVIVDREIPSIPDFFVLIDNKLGGYLATKHLISLGHTDIGCITGPRLISTSSGRLDGYLQALKESGLAEAFVLEGDYNISSGIQAMEKIIQLPEVPSAVFVSNDMMAIGLMMAAMNHGFMIPDDLSIVGFDDIQLAKSVYPGLTTIRHPYTEIGNSVVKLLLLQTERENEQLPENQTQKIILIPELVVRSSTKAFDIK